jgi:RHS repeat-associated protein
MKSFFCSILMIAILLVAGKVPAWAQIHPNIGCAISGTTPVTQGLTYTYTLGAGCTSASGWTCTCGTIVSSTSSSCTISFNQTTCFSAVITATGQATKTVTVNAPPTLGGGTISNPSQAVNYGTTPVLISASAASGGGCGVDGFSYQWLTSTNGTTFTNIPGAVGQNYQPGVLTTTTYFKRQVICPIQSAFTSNTATVTVYPPVVAGSVISSQTINYNTAPATLSASGVSGGSGSYTYQWQSSPNNTFTSPTNIGTNSASYSPPALTSTTWYRVTVSSNGTTPLAGSAATITVFPLLVPGALSPSSQTISSGTTPSALSLSGVTGGSGVYSYQWQSSSNSSFTSPVNVGTNAINYSPPALSSTTFYRVVVTSNGGSLFSTSALVEVALSGGTISGPTGALSFNQPAVFTNITGASNGDCGGSYSYQWWQGPDGSTWTLIPGANGLSYTSGNLKKNTYFVRQVACGPDIVNSTQILVVVTPDLSYIRTRDITRPGIIDLPSAAALTDPKDVKQVTQYMDGLGRPVQTIAQKASPLQKDIVTVQIYDAFGREAAKYLPYTSITTDGNYRLNPLTEQNSFNSGQFPNDHTFYGQTNFEPSPLNRPILTMAPGDSWAGGSRGIVSGYLCNTSLDSLHIWTIGSIPGSLAIDAGRYVVGTVFKNTTTDEAGHQVIEYKDQQGKVLLKKVQLAASPGTAHTGWLNTYYVYDSLDNLRFVIPPRAVELINSVGTWTITQTVADELCFRYEFDYRKRMIIKKVPGAGETWMIYDSRDRLVLTQDAHLRTTHQWLFTKYDVQSRPAVTGLYTNLTYTSQSTMQGFLVSQNMGLSETYQTATYPLYSLNQTFPVETLADVLKFTYYDDYSWAAWYGFSDGSKDNTYDSKFSTASDVTFPYPRTLIQSKITRGMVTGSWDASSGTQVTAMCYDDRGRVIQTRYLNNTAGTDFTTNQYDFSGKPLQTYLRHQKGGSNPQTHTVSTKIQYDAGGRMKSVWKNIDTSASDQLIDSVQYNELGQLQAKWLGNNLDKLAYDYNIRGWLIGINKGYLQQTSGNPQAYFGMELAYDNTTSAVSGASYNSAQFSGNITGTIWKSAGDGYNRKYDFGYDNVNRLTGANFTQQFSNGWSITDPNTGKSIDFTTSNLTYDANGNILSMNQNGWKLGGSVPIDKLTYSYFNSGVSNRLLAVTEDATIDTADNHLGDFTDKNRTLDDYAYDDNGNLIQDKNKRITAIGYSWQNLVATVSFNKDNGSGSKGNIAYLYDATGNKLRKVVTDSSVTPVRITRTDYVGGFEYRNDTLEFTGHEEGRIRRAFHRYLNGDSAYKWEYDYVEKDHLGNTRVLLTQQRDTAQYFATMEAAYRAKELALFYNVDSTCYSKASVPGGYPTDNTTIPNDSVARVNGSGNKVGPALLLKVMSGDSVVIGVKSFFRSGGTVGSPNSSLQNVLNTLAGGLFAVTAGTHGALADINNAGSPAYGSLSSFISTNDPNTSTTPKAYLNWMLLDNQFNYVSNLSGAIAVASPDALQTMAKTLGLHHSGYLYIWVSNETPGWDVFFDNLSVEMFSGPMLEENHYYPFGLTMAGISDKALKTNYAENKYRFNEGTELQNKEFSDGSGLELYETSYRSYDPQIGRFHQIDPLGEINEGWSPYSFVNNNPISLSDPLGLDNDSTGPKPPPPPKDPTVLPEVAVTHLKKDCKTCNAPDPGASAGAAPAGVPALPINPLTPVGPPGKVVPFIEVEPLGAAAATPFLLTVAGVFLPLSAPGEGPNWHPYGVNPNPYPGHGNKLDNWDPHLVYEITYNPPTGLSPTLKYGISDITKRDDNRPEMQVARLKSVYGASVAWKVRLFAPGNAAARAAEQGFVDAHIGLWGARPREQIKP